MLLLLLIWFTPKFFGILLFDWNRSNNRSKCVRCDFWSINRIFCDAQIALLATATVIGVVVVVVIDGSFTLVTFFDLFFSSGKHPVVLFNCSIDWYIAKSAEPIDELWFDRLSLSSSSSSLLLLSMSSLCVNFCKLPSDDVVGINFFTGAGDGVVSKRVIPSNSTCVLMSSLSGSSLNYTDTRLGNSLVNYLRINNFWIHYYWIWRKENKTKKKYKKKNLIWKWPSLWHDLYDWVYVCLCVCVCLC